MEKNNFFSFDVAAPGMLDFKGKAKWEAWKHKAGTSQDKAKQDYINRVKSLVDSVGLK